MAIDRNVTASVQTTAEDNNPRNKATLLRKTKKANNGLLNNSVLNSSVRPVNYVNQKKEKLLNKEGKDHLHKTGRQINRQDRLVLQDKKETTKVEIEATIVSEAMVDHVQEINATITEAKTKANRKKILRPLLRILRNPEL
jgi:hypothetical protein